ncbi:response regulator [Patescibacteria group bacterium]|nr:response regulator [Patescibacteria group bacterium]
MAKKIVLIEDEEILANLLKEKLEKCGFEVLVASDGEEGLEMLKKGKPDLVLLDIVMPKMGGFEVMEEMNKIPELNLKVLPVIVVSNSGQPVEVDRALKLGIRDYLIKTQFDPQEVIDKVNKVFL